MTDTIDTDRDRRRLLRLGGGALLAGLTGCLGLGGSGGSSPTDTAMADTETTMDGTTETAMTDTGMDGTETDGAGMTETTAEGSMSRSFTVRIGNVSTSDTLQTMEGYTAVPLSPGAFVIHTGPGVLFEAGAAASEGLERIAEDGMPGTLVESLSGTELAMASGAFDTPAGADSPGPIGPDGAYEFEVTAGPDARLSFATMFIESNDAFYAPPPAGIPLWSDGEPVSGDVTEQVTLWDAGTEVNQPPGEGSNQAPRQMEPDTGEAENGTVRRISEVDDGFNYPPVANVIDVTITPMG